MNAVRWSPVEPLVATGGADRKVNLWDVGKGIYLRNRFSFSLALNQFNTWILFFVFFPFQPKWSREEY